MDYYEKIVEEGKFSKIWQQKTTITHLRTADGTYTWSLIKSKKEVLKMVKEARELGHFIYSTETNLIITDTKNSKDDLNMNIKGNIVMFQKSYKKPVTKKVKLAEHTPLPKKTLTESIKKAKKSGVDVYVGLNKEGKINSIKTSLTSSNGVNTKILSDIIKYTLAAYKKSSVAGASEVLHAYRFALTGVQSIDIIGFYYDAIKDALSEEIGLMHIDRVMPKRLSRDQFFLWLKTQQTKKYSYEIENRPLLLKEIEKLVTNEFGEQVKKKVVRKYKQKAIIENNDVVGIDLVRVRNS